MFLLQIFSSISISKISSSASPYGEEAIATMGIVLRIVTFGFQFTYSTLYLSIGKALAGGFLSVCRIYTYYYHFAKIYGSKWSYVRPSSLELFDNTHNNTIC